QRYDVPFVQPTQVPQPAFKSEPSGDPSGQNPCFDPTTLYVATSLEDGMNPHGGSDTACTNASTFRYQDRVTREFQRTAETPSERRNRLTRMSGAYGAALQAKQSCKRFLPGPTDNIKHQGNGFSWGGNQQHTNSLCYVLERNPRC
ncbi:hypothetical protein EGW08_021940, partial [Elysia chlorotica]